METIFILNLTQSSFFRYNKKNTTDVGYNKFLLELVTPPEDNILGTQNLSHWGKEDKIIFVPNHLLEYVNKRYNELYY